MSEFETEHNGEIQSHHRIGRLGAAAMGLAWGLTTFEGGTALYHFAIENHDRLTEYTLNNQLLGISIFGVGGAIIAGRFIYNNSSTTAEQ